ncbi:hypothetical protein ACP70R_035063 [Stipagrostis hirtigluma subsp. patula]
MATSCSFVFRRFPGPFLRVAAHVNGDARCVRARVCSFGRLGRFSVLRSNLRPRFGYDEEALRLKGWLCMDVPRAAGSKLKDKLKIYATEMADTADQAAERAAMAALLYMCTYRDVEIDDFSKTLIQQKDEKIASSKFWEQMFQEHAEKMNREAAAANGRYNNLLTDKRKDGLHAQNIATASFALTAELDSPARVDQLARALFKLISGNAIVVLASPAF